MVKFYAEILRSVGFRDNNGKPLASNDPATGTVSWTKNVGPPAPTANSDGDILSITNTSSGIGVLRDIPSLSSTTYPYLVMRMRASVAMTVEILATTVSIGDFTPSLTTDWKTFMFTLASGGTVTFVKIQNQSVIGTIYVDYIYLCGKTPLQLSQTDLINGTIYRTGLGADHAEIALNNRQGKYNTGPNVVGFGDHLHIYLGQGARLFHVYGGYTELQEPTMPADEIVINSRGFGLGLLRSKVLQIYNNQGPRAIFNDVTDNWVNPANKNGLGIASGYQLTRSYIQDLGSAFPLYVTNLNHAYNVFREIGD